MLNRDTKQPIRDRVDYPLPDDVSWPILYHELQSFRFDVMQIEHPDPSTDDTFFDHFAVKVLTSGGLAAVSNESEWQLALQDARQTVWLEGVVKVIVDCAL